MSTPDKQNDTQTGPKRGGYEAAQREIRERNDAARQAAKKQRADQDRRDDNERNRRYERDGVYR